MRVHRGVSRNSLVRLGVLALLLAAATPAQVQQQALPELDAQLEPLKSRFNADVGKVRLILLLDPT